MSATITIEFEITSDDFNMSKFKNDLIEAHKNQMELIPKTKIKSAIISDKNKEIIEKIGG